MVDNQVKRDIICELNKFARDNKFSFKWYHYDINNETRALIADAYYTNFYFAKDYMPEPSKYDAIGSIYWKLSDEEVNDICREIKSSVIKKLCPIPTEKERKMVSIDTDIVTKFRSQVKKMKEVCDEIIEDCSLIGYGGYTFKIDTEELNKSYSNEMWKNMLKRLSNSTYGSKFSGTDNMEVQLKMYNKYIQNDVKITENLYKHYQKLTKTVDFNVEDVIFNPPATIVFWKDGTKTVVKAEGETYDPEKGLAMAISKKYYGNNRDYYILFKKYLKKYNKQNPNKEKPIDILETSNVIAKFRQLEAHKHDTIQKAYDILVNYRDGVSDDGLDIAIGYLGEYLND